MDLGPRSGRPRRRVGLLLDALYNEYANLLVTAFETSAARRDHDLWCFAGGQLHSLAGHERSRNRCFDLVSDLSVDALVVLSLGAAGDVVAQFLERYPGLPKLSLGHLVPGLPVVTVDNTAGMREAVTHVATVHRKRRIVFLRGPETNQEAAVRFAAYRQALQELGIPYDPALVYYGDFSHEVGRRAMRELLEQGTEFDAVVGANDYSALGALEALRDAGCGVPHDVAVIGFDDAEESRGAAPPLSTVRQPYFEIAEAALTLLDRLWDGQQVPAETVLGARLVRRRSCGCLSEGAPSEAPPSFHPEQEPFEIAYQKRRPELAAELTWAESAARVNGAPGWETKLLDALYGALTSGSDRELVGILEDLFQRTTLAAGDLGIWQQTLSTLRRKLLPLVMGRPSRWARLEEVWQRLRILIADAVEREQRALRALAERSAGILTDTSESLITSFDVESLPRALSDRLPALDIRSCFLALYDGWGTPPAESRLLVGYDRGRLLDIPRDGLTFPTIELVPAGMLGERRRAMVVEPLFFENHQLGFVLFELGPKRRVVYELLRELVSAALRGADLLKRVREEAAQREQAEKRRLEQELEIATRIQTSILPRTLDAPGLFCAATMLPATEVGGDYYDVLPTARGCWIGIGDVAGHGLRSGLVMMMLQSVVAALVRDRPNAAPSEVLEVVNAVLYDNVRERLAQDEHATLTLIRYDASGSLTFAGAHEEIVIFRARSGDVELVATPGTWVGATRDIRAVTVDSRVQLEPGDVLVLYTDGVIEAEDGAGEQFGIERLTDELRRVADRPVAEIRDELLAAVTRFLSTQSDDLALVVARYRGEP